MILSDFGGNREKSTFDKKNPLFNLIIGSAQPTCGDRPSVDVCVVSPPIHPYIRNVVLSYYARKSLREYIYLFANRNAILFKCVPMQKFGFPLFAPALS